MKVRGPTIWKIFATLQYSIDGGVSTTHFVSQQTVYTLSIMSFDGKVVLITGSSSGIGAACAKYFAKEGASLALVGRNAEKFERLVENIKESGVENEPLVILADVTVDAERIITETIEKFGRLDVLINNAGFLVRGTIETTPMEDFDNMTTTMLRAVVELTKLAVPYLIETKGNIVNVSSCVGIISVENCIVYSMIKAAINYFTKCLALDLAANGVRVNALCPGFIADTDLHSHYIGAEKDTDEFNAAIDYMTTINPLQMNGTTDDCVNAVEFLTKEQSNFLTGIILTVDGGISIKGAL